ncbi:hypothetical protein ACSTS3_14485 [Aquimarina muelleri]|uniref:hypothetical protein n=1 Tax=Aquimarina muelleri TaxID=279356 RepID=UPI003F6868E9
MEIKSIFEHISKGEGILIDDVAKNLGVAKSTLYYSINKNELSHKLRKSLKAVYPKYYSLIDQEIENEKRSKNENELDYIAEFVIKNEEKLLANSKFKLWLKTKVQEGVIEVLSIKK